MTCTSGVGWRLSPNIRRELITLIRSKVNNVECYVKKLKGEIMKYLLSIIIPTKNRYEYLRYCIESLSQLDTNITEIIIQDNSDNNEDFLIFLDSNDYKNVKYFYLADMNISQTENSELALQKADRKSVV